MLLYYFLNSFAIIVGVLFCFVGICLAYTIFEWYKQKMDVTLFMVGVLIFLIGIGLLCTGSNFYYKGFTQQTEDEKYEERIDF